MTSKIVQFCGKSRDGATVFFNYSLRGWSTLYSPAAMYFVSEKRPDSVQLLSLILVCTALVCKDFQINCCLHYDVLLPLLLQVSSE